MFNNSKIGRKMGKSKPLIPKMIRVLIVLLAENIARVVEFTLWDDCVDMLLISLEKHAVKKFKIQGAKYEFRGYVKRNIARREADSRLIITYNQSICNS
jgi:hypothetical protein